jgi:hypothetical protein
MTKELNEANVALLKAKTVQDYDDVITKYNALGGAERNIPEVQNNIASAYARAVALLSAGGQFKDAIDRCAAAINDGCADFKKDDGNTQTFADEQKVLWQHYGAQRLAVGAENDLKYVIDTPEITLPALKVNAAIALLTSQDHDLRVGYLAKVCAIADGSVAAQVGALKQHLAIEYAYADKKAEFDALGAPIDVVRQHAIHLSATPATTSDAVRILLFLRAQESDSQASNALAQIAQTHNHGDPDTIAKILGTDAIGQGDVL